MGLLKPMKMEETQARVGCYGPLGSGKTSTLAQMAIGISKQYCSGAPVAFFDTEKSSDFTKPLFDAEGVGAMVAKSRSFQDLIALPDEAIKAGCCALIVDSITHVWVELAEAYCRKKNVKRIEFQHWKDIKQSWAQWTYMFQNSGIHMFVAGRAGWEYEYQENENTHKQELIKGGTKMKAENEFGYEPNLLIELWVDSQDDGERGSSLLHRGVVKKDRTWKLNGKPLVWHDRPVYKAGEYKLVYDVFAPHFAALNIGGKDVPMPQNASDGMFNANGDSAWREAQQKRTELLELIQASTAILWPGQTAQEKAIRIKVMDKFFGTRSWSAVEQMHNHKLQHGLNALLAVEMLVKDDASMEIDALLDRGLKVAEELRDARPKPTQVSPEEKQSRQNDSLGITDADLPRVPASELTDEEKKQKALFATDVF